MLPFLKRKDESGAASSEVKLRKPDEGAEEFDSMHAAAEDLINAIHSKNIKAVAEALRAAFELAGSAPQEESHE